MDADALAHDVAVAAATHLVEIISPCLREEERREAFAEFFAVCLAMLAAYELQMSRRRDLPSPSLN